MSSNLLSTPDVEKTISSEVFNYIIDVKEPDNSLDVIRNKYSFFNKRGLPLLSHVLQKYGMSMTPNIDHNQIIVKSNADKNDSFYMYTYYAGIKNLLSYPLSPHKIYAVALNIPARYKQDKNAFIKDISSILDDFIRLVENEMKINPFQRKGGKTRKSKKSRSRKSKKTRKH